MRGRGREGLKWKGERKMGERENGRGRKNGE
jgi:hypothetical protein